MANKAASNAISVAKTGAGATSAWTINGLNGADDIDVNALLNATSGGHTGASWKIIGGNGADKIKGSYHSELIWGDSEKDSDTSANGADTIYGGGGNDEIHGGNGPDFIQGDADGDTLYGGRGPDTFNYVLVGDSTATAGHLWAGTVSAANSSGDWIRDFSKSEGDKLNLSGLNGQLTGGGPSMLQWSGTTGAVHGVWTGAYGNGTSDTIVYVDTSGDGLADVAIRVSGSIDGSAIAGVNHGPNAANDTKNVNEDQTVTGNVATNDSDPDGDTLTYSISGTAPAGLTLNANGTYSFNAGNAAYQHLAAGATQDVVATIDVSDGHGGTTTETLTIHITGVNDAATFGANDSGSVTEDADPNTVGGTLTVSDVDDGQSSLTAQSGTSGSYGSFSIDSSGNWTYTLDNSNSSVNGLNVGDHLTDTFTVYSADGTSHSVTVTINGANDAATFGSGPGVDEGSVDETGSGGDELQLLSPIDTGTTSGTLTVSDVDSPTTIVPQDGDTEHGHFTIDADGNWTFTLDQGNDEVQALNDDDNLTETVTVTSADGTTHEITITINGANDAATFSGDDAGTSTEDSATNPISGTLVVDDVDNAGNVVAQTDAAGDNGYGTFSIDENGHWTYSLDNSNAAVNGLNTDSTPLTDSLTITTDDGTEHVITVTINGANDAPLAAPTNSVTTDEDTGSAAVAIGASDVDDTSLTYSTKEDAGPSNGSVDYDQDNGTFTYTPDSNYNGSDSFTILVTDGHGGTTEQVVSVTVNAVNDNPTADSPNGVTTDEDMASAAVAIGASDVDGDTLNYSTKADAGPSHGTVAYDQDAGTFVYTPSPNYSGSDSFTIVISDGHDGSTEQVVSVTVNPVDDPGSIAGDKTGSVTEDNPTTTSAGTLTVNDVDGPAGFVSQTNTAGTYGTFSIDADGNWTYTLDNSKGATNALGNSDHPTETFSVTANDGATTNVVVTVNGHADNDGHPPTGPGFTFDENLYDNGTFLNKGTAVGTFAAHSEGAITWALTENPNNYFVIDPATGALKVNADQVPEGTYHVTASATDGDGSSTTGLFVVVGTSHADTVNMSSSTDPVFVMALNGADGINTGAQGDYILGGGAGDTIVAGNGNDTIFGGGGDDFITGGGGADLINADQGKDTIVYTAASESTAASADLVKNFTVGSDKLDLSALGVTAFGGDSINPGAHNVTFHYEPGSNQTLVYVDTNGVSGADMLIKLDGNIALTHNEFGL